MKRTPITVTADQVDAYNAKQRANRIKRAQQPEKRPAQRRRDGEMGERRCKQLVGWRSNGDCEIRIPGVCTGRGLDGHHRLFRSQGGLWLPSNIVHACRRCHEAVTNTRGRRAIYEANGWIVRKQDPHHVPVLLGGSVMALLDDLGDWTATTEAAA